MSDRSKMRMPWLVSPQRLGCLAALAACAVAADVGPAHAAAYVSVLETWTATVDTAFGALPPGVTIACYGGATPVTTGCSDSLSTAAIAGLGLPGVSVSGTVATFSLGTFSSDAFALSKGSGLSIINATGAAIGPVFIKIDETAFSPFNTKIPGASPPPGVDAGAAVDAYPQRSGFSSTLSLQTPSLGPTYVALDHHECLTTNVILACGVLSPDSSIFDISTGIILAGSSVQFDFQQVITGVPEPISLSIVMTGIMGLALGRRTRGASRVV